MTIPVDVLQGLQLLASLPHVTVAHLAQHASERSFAKREVVLQKGNPPSALCFLLEGRLQGVDFTMDDREVGLYFINPGDYFGEVAVVDSQVQPEFVTAVARSRVVFIARDLIKPILFASPKVAESLCTRLATRLRSVSAQRRILGLSNPVQRVCAQLEQFYGAPLLAGASHRVLNAPTHQELAIMINASRETVTRVFQLLQGRGVVERDGNDLMILDANFIGQVASGKLDVSK
jgi:CRP/FNR family cyclic AMP-dependent transcriptional regulator